MYSRVTDDGIVYLLENGLTQSWNDLPAVYFPSGQIEWHHRGVRHRDSGPAVKNPTVGMEAYYINGLLHGSPAVYTPQTSSEQIAYYKNGVPHNTEGPAIITVHDILLFYYEGILHNSGGPAIIYPNGSEEYYENGIRHRDDGPAVYHEDGLVCYFQNGKLHCNCYPAIDTGTGYKEWRLEGLRHRGADDPGPAVYYPDGTVEYWWQGTQVTEEEYNDIISP